MFKPLALTFGLLGLVTVWFSSRAGEDGVGARGQVDPVGAVAAEAAGVGVAEERGAISGEGTHLDGGRQRDRDRLAGDAVRDRAVDEAPALPDEVDRRRHGRVRG